MPIFSPAPVNIPKKKSKVPSAASVKKSSNLRRRPLDEDTTVYGDALFDAANVPMKVVYVTFHELLENNVRISKCRKFAIEYFPFHHQQVIDHEVEEGEKPIIVWIQSFNLYFFKASPNPLLAYNSDLDKEFTIPYEKATESFLNIELINEVENKIVALEKLAQIEEMLKEESEVKEDESPIDAAGTTNDAEVVTDSVTENASEKTESISEAEILLQVGEEEKESPVSEPTQG